MQPIDQFEHAGLIVDIDADYSPDSPRTWDNFGVMWSANYNGVCDLRADDGLTDADYTDAERAELDEHGAYLADEEIVAINLAAHRRIGSAVIPYYTDRNGGLIQCSDDRATGYIYATVAMMRREHGDTLPIAELRDRATGYLRDELDTFKQWQDGDVYGASVYTKSENGKPGELLDSCWGFYGYDYAVEQGREMADAARVHLDRQRAEDDAEVADLVAY